MIFITPVEITPGTVSAWTDVDISSYVPVGTTGVILHFVNTSYIYALGWRKNGSSDNRTNNFYVYSEDAYNHHFWGFCGVDASRILELFVGNITYIDVYLVGYFMSDAVFFTNSPDKSLSGINTWTDIDISTNTGADTAIAAMFEIAPAEYSWGFRKNGSSDNRYQLIYYHGAAIVGVDASEVCEGYIGNVLCDFFLNGYCVSEVSMYTNAIDASMTNIGQWLDLPALPTEAKGGFYEVWSTPSFYGRYGFRKNGSTEDIYAHEIYHAWAAVECDASKLIEGKIINLSIDFWLVGYPIFVSAKKSLLDGFESPLLQGVLIR